MPSFFGAVKEESSKFLRSIHDEIGLLIFYHNFSFTEAYNLPVILRGFYIEQAIDFKKKEKEAVEKARKKK